MNLLTVDNYKTRKGESEGYLTAVLHLAPHTVSGSNMCPRASAGCSAACLNTAGKGVNPHIQLSRIRRTRMYVDEKAAFLDLLRADLGTLERKAHREGMSPAVRLNATSDQPKMAINLAKEFADIQFYDYTKIKEVFGWPLPDNYYPTFSRSETNWGECVEILDAGFNVATVFIQRPNYYKGYEVINGDLSDLRFLDKRGVIVGLSAKGKGKKDQTGFVVRAEDIPQATDLTLEDDESHTEPLLKKTDYASVEKGIRAAIKERFCTQGQIKRFLDADRETPLSYDDVKEVLDGMVVEKKIVSPNFGSITAYFLADNVPSRYWLDGTGRVAMEFGGEPVVAAPRKMSDEEADKLLSSWRAYPEAKKSPIEEEFEKLSTDEEIDEETLVITKVLSTDRLKDFDVFHPDIHSDETEANVLQSDIQNGGRVGRKPHTWDYFEVARKVQPEHKTDGDLAELFGVHRNTIGRYLKTDPKFAEAVRCGREGDVPIFRKGVEGEDAILPGIPEAEGKTEAVKPAETVSCSDCGNAVTSTFDGRCLKCHDAHWQDKYSKSAISQNCDTERTDRYVCPECSGPKSPTSKRCQDCFVKRKRKSKDPWSCSAEQLRIALGGGRQTWADVSGFLGVSSATLRNALNADPALREIWDAHYNSIPKPKKGRGNDVGVPKRPVLTRQDFQDALETVSWPIEPEIEEEVMPEAKAELELVKSRNNIPDNSQPDTHTFEVTVPIATWVGLNGAIAFEKKSLDEFVADAIDCSVGVSKDFAGDDNLQRLAGILKPAVPYHHIAIDQKPLLEFFLSTMSTPAWENATIQQLRLSFGEFMGKRITEALKS